MAIIIDDAIYETLEQFGVSRFRVITFRESRQDNVSFIIKPFEAKKLKETDSIISKNGIELVFDLISYQTLVNSRLTVNDGKFSIEQVDHE